jgi:uncharacterized protein (TIGR02118 family)
MIKLLYCIRRKPGLSLAEFQQHWREHHADLVRRVTIVRRYVQLHTLAEDPIREAMAQAGASGLDTFDGVAVLWLDSLEALRTAIERDPAVTAALDDEKFFIDHGRSTACIADEHVVVEPVPPGNIVLIECLRRRADIDRPTFSERWIHHQHIGKRAYSELGLLMGYIQNHTLVGDAGRVPGVGGADEPFDGIVQGFFHSIATFKALVGHPLAYQESFNDEKHFIDHSRSVDLLTRRHVIKDLIR